jgi:hypothetical protein
VNVNAVSGVDRVEYYIDPDKNPEFRYKTVTAPYDGLIRIPYGDPDGTHHTITAKVFDKAGYVGVSSIDITVSSTTALNTASPLQYGNTIIGVPSTITPVGVQ